MGSLNTRRKLLEMIRGFRSKQGEEEKISKEKSFVICPKCRRGSSVENLKNHLWVCPHCGNHFKISGEERLNALFDKGYEKIHFHSRIYNPIDFPDYEKLREKIKKKMNLEEALVIAKGKIYGEPAFVCVLEQEYLMGSLGTYMGEEIVSMFEKAMEEKIPVIIFSASGGARMQEGIFSLMQMAKTAAAIGEFSRRGLLYISVLTNPTTGGVSASFASLGDVIIAEPDALIGFAGPRVIEQTVRQTLPEGFQRAEKLEECGFVDCISPREEQRKTIHTFLSLHRKTGAKYESNL